MPGTELGDGYRDKQDTAALRDEETDKKVKHSAQE